MDWGAFSSEMTKIAGWWAASPDNPSVGGKETGLYNGDGPADLMGDALADIDLQYQQAFGRPATNEEYKIVFDFVMGGRKASPEPVNPWIPSAAGVAGSKEKLLNLPIDKLRRVRSAFRNFRYSNQSNLAKYRESVQKEVDQESKKNKPAEKSNDSDV